MTRIGSPAFPVGWSRLKDITYRSLWSGGFLLRQPWSTLIPSGEMSDAGRRCHHHMSRDRGVEDSEWLCDRTPLSPCTWAVQSLSLWLSLNRRHGPLATQGSQPAGTCLGSHAYPLWWFGSLNSMWSDVAITCARQHLSCPKTQG